MRPVHPGGENVSPFVKPRDWDDDKLGPCGTLHVRQQVEGSADKHYVGYVSHWRPNGDEVAMLANGGVIELMCCGIQPAVSVGAAPCADKEAPVTTTPMQAIRGAVARGWCHGPNTEKEMDSDLAEAISKEVAAMIGVAG